MWGIDIGDSALKAVKLKRVGKQIVLQDFQVVPYSDVSGELGTRREGMIAEALVELRSRGMGKSPCFVSIAPQAVFSRFISLPPVDKRRIPEIVLYEARQQIPFSLDEVIWAYQTVRKTFEPGEEIEIGLFAVKRDVVDSYLDELAPIAAQIQGIQVGPLAMHNFVCHELSIDKPTVILDVGSQSTDLLIMDGDKFWLRNLPIAGNSFTNILEKRLNIPRAEAEKLKLDVADSRHRRKILEVLRPVMRDLVAEVQRSIGYYKSLSQEVKFDSIMVLGNGYRLFGLDRFLADQLQYEIIPVQQLQNVPFQGDVERVGELEKTVGALGPALGLALQGLGEAHGTINLLPDDYVIKRELAKKRIIQPLVAAGLIWGIIFCFWLKEGRGIGEMEALHNIHSRVLSQRDDLANKLDKANTKLKANKTELYEKRGRFRQYYVDVARAMTASINMRFTIEEPGFTFGPGKAGGGDDGARGGRRGRSARGGEAQPDALKTAKCKLVCTFNVAAQGTADENVIYQDLVSQIKKATIFAEGMPVVIDVDVVNLKLGSDNITDIEGNLVAKDTVTAEIRVGLIGGEEIAKAYDDYKAKLIKDAEEKAARDRVAAEEAARAAEAASAATAETDTPDENDR
jgi:type IV pilus assembly protein PilM